MDAVKTGLVGISGIGGYHRDLIHSLETVEFVAAADMWPERERVQEAAAMLAGWGVPCYNSIEEMLDAAEVEMVVIATPHPYHAPYTEMCLNRDLDVLCEKPVTILASDGVRLTELAKAKGKRVAVDFQYTSYNHSRKLKEIICSGELGELREIVAVMEWKRTDEYYQRADWAGKRYYGGYACWDGVLMNQAVHLLNSSLQMAGPEGAHAVPERIQAEMYRVHDIECEDIACFRADLGDTVLQFYATTCCDADHRTTLDIIGTKGRASWNTEKAVVQIDGRDEIVFDEPSDRDAIHKNLVACMRGQESKLYAPIAEAVKATLTINGAYVSAGSIPKRTWDDIGDLRTLMDAAADERKLLSEMPGVAWGQASEVVELADFTTFAGLADD